jgi:hypothetical protein
MTAQEQIEKIKFDMVEDIEAVERNSIKRATHKAFSLLYAETKTPPALEDVADLVYRGFGLYRGIDQDDPITWIGDPEIPETIEAEYRYWLQTI